MNHAVLNSEIEPNYGSILRRDKAVNTGGGVLVAVNAEIPITRRLDQQPANTELLVTDLNKSNS